jgi:hypothetical protein
MDDKGHDQLPLWVGPWTEADSEQDSKVAARVTALLMSAEMRTLPADHALQPLLERAHRLSTTLAEVYDLDTWRELKGVGNELRAKADPATRMRWALREPGRGERTD